MYTYKEKKYFFFYYRKLIKYKNKKNYKDRRYLLQ